MGDRQFVERVLKSAEDRLERRHALGAKDHGFEAVVARVAEVLDIETRDVFGRGKNANTVKARSLLCYWADRELGLTTFEWITVDHLEIAQFIWLLLNNHKLRDVINTVTSKAVLILGRFSEPYLRCSTPSATRCASATWCQ